MQRLSYGMGSGTDEADIIPAARAAEPSDHSCCLKASEAEVYNAVGQKTRVASVQRVWESNAAERQSDLTEDVSFFLFFFAENKHYTWRHKNRFYYL